MLTKIEIRNFQCHEKLQIDLAPITTIIGPNGAGKTGVLRAIHWAVFNRPSGTAFIKQGHDKARVRVTVDGYTVERSRTKAGNQYVLDGDTFSAIGSDVPPEIAAVFKARPENFQGQLDPPFWLGLTPGQVSKELNEIVNLGLIDTSMAFVDSELRKQKASAQIITERITEASALVDSLAFAPEMDKQLRALEQKSAKVEEITGRVVEFEEAVGTLECSRSRMNKLRRKADAGSALAALMDKIDDYESNMKLIENILDSYAKAEKTSHERRSTLAAHENELSRLLKDRCPVCGRTDNG